MKIVILDGYTINPGDLSWEAFQRLGELAVYDRTAPAEVLPRICDAHAVLTTKVPMTREIFSVCPSLKYLGILATGYNLVDLEAAQEYGITVTYIPAYSTFAVAQHTIALLLAMTNRVGEHSMAVQQGAWCWSPDFCFWISPMTELAGKTLCIFGLGQIGTQVAKLGLVLGMEVIAVGHRKEQSALGGVRLVSREIGFETADVLSLHCPLTDETYHLIDQRALSLMKRTALLINTSRGPLCDEQAIADALNNNRLGGYAADVVCVEPMQESNPLRMAKNCVLTPHIAWAPQNTRGRLIAVAAENLKSFLEGHAQNVIG